MEDYQHLLREPISNTCPDIDAVLAELAKADDLLSVVERLLKHSDEDCEVFEAHINYARQHLDVLSALEDLRRSNEKLREWGNNLVAAIEKINVEYNDKIEELEADIEDKDELTAELREELYELRSNMIQ